MLVALAALSAAGPAAAQSPLGLRPKGSTFRVVVIPIQVAGKRAPSAPKLRRMLDRASRWYAKASYNRMRLEGAVAPTFVAGPLTRALQRDDKQAWLRVLDWAAARGVPVDGALPIYVGPGLKNPYYGPDSSHRSGGSVDGGVVIRSTQWRLNEIVVHEFGHALGMHHANVQACRRGVHSCRHGNHWATAEYGDPFDNMGLGSEWLGAYHLAALGLAPIVDAPTGQGVTTIRPHSSGDPTLLRLRAANRDWYIDSHTTYLEDFPRRRFRLPSNVVVSYANPTFVIPQSTFLPNPIRYPHSVARGCGAICVGRFLYRPGRRLTVPGVFTMRVLGGRRVRTRWLDRTPPVLTVASSAVAVPFGGAPELRASVRADARGAGVLAVEVDQGGAITRVPADSIRGLVRGRSGRGVVRVPLAGVGSAAIRLVDAAGNASPWTPLDLSRRVPTATVSFSPSLAPDGRSATRLTGSRTVTISGQTDPSFAGLSMDIDVAGEATRYPVTIGPGGTFSMVWAPKARGQYRIDVHPPVERMPDGFNLRRELHEGYVRW